MSDPNTRGVAFFSFDRNYLSGNGFCGSGDGFYATPHPASISTVLKFYAPAGSRDGVYTWLLGTGQVSMTISGGLIVHAGSTGTYLPGSGGIFDSGVISTSFFSNGNGAVGYGGDANGGGDGATFCCELGTSPDTFQSIHYVVGSSLSIWVPDGPPTPTACTPDGKIHGVTASGVSVPISSPTGGSGAVAIPSGVSCETVLWDNIAGGISGAAVIDAYSVIKFYPSADVIPPADLPKNQIQVTNTSGSTVGSVCFGSMCFGGLAPGQTGIYTVPAIPGTVLTPVFTKLPCYLCEPTYGTPITTPPTWDPNNPTAPITVYVPPFAPDPDPTPHPQPDPTGGGNENNFQGCIANPCAIPYIYDYQSTPVT
jgi:hypothetical protein